MTDRPRRRTGRPHENASLELDPWAPRRADLGRRHWLLQAGSAMGTLIFSGCTLPAAPVVETQATRLGLPPAPSQEGADPAVDTQLAPHQFSRDLGFVQDGELHSYVEAVGREIQAAAGSESRPCTVRIVNAHHLNAYSFPGGSIGLTRGWLGMLQDEAELAAVLAHQLGHLGTRQVEQALPRSEVRKKLLASTLTLSQASAWSPLIGLTDPLGDSPLLGDFTAEQEDEAAKLALDYLTRAGYPAQAWIRVMDRLKQRAQMQPGLAAAYLRRHPLDGDRLRRAREHATSLQRRDPLRVSRTHAARWSDRMAWLQRLNPVIEACQLGELAMVQATLPQAQIHLERALQLDPGDYATRVRLAQCLQTQGRYRDALLHAQAAQALHPREAQAHRLVATLQLSLRDPAKAWLALEQYDHLLPGDPGAIFLQGVALEAMGRTRHAAEHYRTYLRLTREGQAAQYALSRLKTLGYPP